MKKAPTEVSLTPNPTMAEKLYAERIYAGDVPMPGDADPSFTWGWGVCKALAELKKQATSAVSTPSEGRDLANQILGQAQALTAAAGLLRTFGVSKLAFVKETKGYKHLAGQVSPNGTEFDGTWEGYCAMLGMSVDKVDADIANLRAFGEEALDSMSRMGIGYRDLAQYRRLPDDEKTALIEAARTGDKDTLLDLAESMMVKHSAEKEALTARTAELEEEAQRLHRREANYEAEIERATLQIKNLTSGKKKLTDFSFRTEEVREECMALGKGVEVHLQGLKTLFESVVTTGAIDTEYSLQIEQVWVAAHIAAAKALDLIEYMHGQSAGRGLPDRILSQHCLTPAEAEKWLHDAPLIANAYEGAKAAREAQREAQKPKTAGRPKGSQNKPKA